MAPVGKDASHQPCNLGLVPDLYMVEEENQFFKLSSDFHLSTIVCASPFQVTTPK